MKKFIVEENQECKAKIKVIGVGGGGGNAVNNMINSGMDSVDFAAANTDAQALGKSGAKAKIQLGRNKTNGLGAGANPAVGEESAQESAEIIRQEVEGYDMVFIAAGMGGGTGTGGAPVVAEMAKESGALTVGVVTKPFPFEGSLRMRHAEEGIRKLAQKVDSLIVIPNGKLLEIGGKGLTVKEGFNMADNVLLNAVRGISDLINIPGLINLDFADVRTVMSNMGRAIIGTGISSGEKTAIDAAEEAINSPLIENISIAGARGVIISITGGPNLTLPDISEVANVINRDIHPEGNVIFGASIDETLGDKIAVTVIATGFETRKTKGLFPGGGGARNYATEAPVDYDRPPAQRRRYGAENIMLPEIIRGGDTDSELSYYDRPTFQRADKTTIR